MTQLMKLTMPSRLVLPITLGLIFHMATASPGQVFDFPDVEAGPATPPAVVPEERAKEDAAQNKELTPQELAIMQQLRPILQVELSFAKRAAQLDDNQVKTLVENIRPKFITVARRYTKNQNQLHGVMVFGNRPVGNQAKSPRDAIAEEVAAQIKQVANEAQQEAFEAEVQARHDFRKRAALDQLVALFDEALMFTPEQCEAIRKSLEQRYQSSWADNVEAIGQFSQGYYPIIPAAAITPHLTEDQKRIWQRLQKVNASVGLGNNMWGSTPIDDIDLSKIIPDAAAVERVEQEGLF